jgi:hypothetical protein
MAASEQRAATIRAAVHLCTLFVLLCALFAAAVCCAHYSLLLCTLFAAAVRTIRADVCQYSTE